MTALYLHEDVKELLAGKTLVVIGDSVERSIYKDLVLLLQENRYLKDAELRKKGEESFIGDELVYGGCKGEMKNSINYRECRYFKTEDDACCRYYFVTICYGNYVEEVLQELSLEPTDIIVMNSCLWDVHRHGKKGIEQYEENLEKLVSSLRRLLPDCLFLWLTTPPVDIKSKGGFLMRPGQDLVKINEVRYCNQIAREVFSSANETDRRFRIVDLGYVFQYFEHHRASDGVHWNEKAHRRISNLILEEVAKAFNMEVPRSLPLAPYDAPPMQHQQHPHIYDNMNMEENMPFPGMQNNFDYNNGHMQHEWEMDNSMHVPFDRPPLGPRGFPFGSPRMPPPHPFGPMDFMRPAFIDDGGYPEGVRDLDDLGEARRQVEERLRVRQYSEPDTTNTNEKSYRFGVASDQLVMSSLKRKLSTSDIQQSSKVTIIESEGDMKKLVKLNDGTTLHSVMTNKEKEDYKKKQEKLRQEQVAKEKAEKLRKEQEEKRKAEQEEQKRKKKEEEEKAAEAAKEKFKELKKVDLSNLPTVSEVPEEKKNDKENEENKSKSKISNFANKLLSFIKNPLSKASKEKNPIKADLDTIPSLLSKEISIPHSKFPHHEPFTCQMSRFDSQESHKSNGSTSFPPQVHPNSNVTISDSTPSSEIESSKEVPPLIKKVDTLALLSMPSPFAKTKPPSSSPEPPPPGTEDSLEASIIIPERPVIKVEPSEKPPISDVQPLPNKTLSSNVKPAQNELPVEPSKVSSDKVNLKEDDFEKELLQGDEDTTLSDVDDSILNDEEKTKEQSNVATVLEQKPSAQNENKRKSIIKEEKANKKLKTDEIANVSNTPQSADSGTATETSPLKKKKKKAKNPNETKEERTARRKLKREKKEKLRKEKEKAKLEKEKAEKLKIEVKDSKKIQVVEAGQWNKPFSHNHYEPRQRSATWTQLYQPTYAKTNNAPLYKQQFVVNQSGGINSATVVVNPYQTVNQQAFRKQQEQLIEQQRQQRLLQQQIVQQQLLQQQSLLLRQQNDLNKSSDSTTMQQNTTGSTPQLYIDEYGQTYTLEEETFMIGPAGEIQNISSGMAVGNNLLQQQQQQHSQQQQQQQGVQQQYMQSSLIYTQQQHQSARFL